MFLYSKKYNSLHQEIHRILLEEWDPIGVRNIPEAQDEYDSYISDIYNMLIARKSEYEIFKYIWWLETEHMGLNSDRQRAEKYAERLISLIRE